MNEMEQALSDALNLTGFPFEHFAFCTAQALGWNTRSSRLYIDPEEAKTREMDLLCYRHGKGAEVNTCTAVLVSCKARTGKPWVLLTRPWPARVPTWYPYPPVAVWTNCKVLHHEVGKSSWGADYFNLADASGLKSWAADSPREVFALHEFEAVQQQTGRGKTDPSARRFKSNGDASLYEGTMSLLKALAYEKRAVDERRGTGREQRVYQFNLVQLLDGDLYEAAFEGHQAPTVRKIDRYRYFARTMLDGKDFSARIEFCTRSAFVELLGDLARVHEFNCAHFDSRVRTFYETVLMTPERRDFLSPELGRRLAPYVSIFGGVERPSGTAWARVEARESTLKVLLMIDEAVVSRLKLDEHFSDHVARVVKDLYRHSGPIEVEWDDEIPF